MTKRLPVSPSPGPLERYAARFDDLFGARAQRQGFRRTACSGSSPSPGGLLAA